jgi:hypothetical protein
MQATGRTPIPTTEAVNRKDSDRQKSDDTKRESRLSLMKVVAKATDVTVKRAPVAKKGELPETQWDYHERIITCRKSRSKPL